MKFLVITKTKDVFLMLPPERQMEISNVAFAYIDKYRKAGNCKEIYTMPGWNRVMLIWEAESGEEATRQVMENPMAPFSDMESYGLADWDAYVKGAKALMKARR